MNKIPTMYIKYIMVLLMASTLLISSCKKENQVETESEAKLSKVDVKLLNEVRELPSESARRAAFSILAPEEKLALLNLQFDYILAEIPLNAEQKSFIKQMKSEFKTDMYSTDQQIKSKFLENTVNKFRLRFKDVFGDDFVRNYFTAIINPNPGLAPTIQVNAPKPQCECSFEADWCAIGKRCNPDFVNACVHVIEACGDFLLFPCDGKCKIKETPE